MALTHSHIAWDDGTIANVVTVNGAKVRHPILVASLPAPVAAALAIVAKHLQDQAATISPGPGQTPGELTEALQRVHDARRELAVHEAERVRVQLAASDELVELSKRTAAAAKEATDAEEAAATKRAAAEVEIAELDRRIASKRIEAEAPAGRAVRP